MANNSLKKVIFITILLLCSLAFPQLASAQDKSPQARIAQLLEESKYSYTKAADNVWAIAFEGKALTKFNVFATTTTQQDILVVFVVVAEKKRLKVSPELTQKLLKLNEEMLRVKVGIDGEGDMFVRVDLSIRVLDSQELKTNVEQVAAAADEVFAATKSFITIAK
jgi:Putative bacterial sensory transduction regulator